MSALHTAIDHLSRVFARIPRPRHIDGCQCCIGRKGIGPLTTEALRTLTPSQLSSYAASAFLTMDGDDYLHFLPRILEITATDQS